MFFILAIVYKKKLLLLCDNVDKKGQWFKENQKYSRILSPPTHHIFPQRHPRDTLHLWHRLSRRIFLSGE